MRSATRARRLGPEAAATDGPGRMMDRAPPARIEWRDLPPETMPRLPLALAAALLAAAPAAAQWPTTRWVVMDTPGGDLTEVPIIGGELDQIATLYVPPLGERALFAAKHQGILEGASTWFQSLRFPAPLQQTEDRDLTVGPGEPYLAVLMRDTDDNSSAHSTSGSMELTVHPGFLSADTPMWTLMEASAVHEVYHGIQDALSPSLVARKGSHLPQIPGCRTGEKELHWLIEGTAAMAQIRWIEGRAGAPYGHPFMGSHRAAWVRRFDQPLHLGSLPPEHQNPGARLEMTPTESVSWFCTYGTWYFWYAIGDMIARTDAEKVSYTQYLFAGSRPWDDGGIANVDAGLRAAAAATNAIRPYRNGLYDLYPEFVAQYLTEDRFYGHLEEVVLGAPALFETTSSLSGGPIGPLATRAWRVRVRLPQNASPIPYTVRFTLDAADGTDRDDLHLIVGDDVVGRPADPTAPYADVKRIDGAPPTADGSVEYLVRVANVAEAAEETADAEFSLRVEVEGFYGSDVAGEPSTAGVAGALPPGFTVRGPGPWACSGSAAARAVFDLVTPDEQVRDIDRALPEAVRNTDDMMDDLAIMLRRAEQQGRNTGMAPEQLEAVREQVQARIAAARAEAQPDLDEAAANMRAQKTTGLAATFVGQGSEGECQVVLSATLAGREGGAQILAGAVDEDRFPEDEAPTFTVRVYTRELLDVLRGQRPPTRGRDEPEWVVCTMTDREQQRTRESATLDGCPAVVCTAGHLTLEVAEQGRIAGTFEFEVVRWVENRAISGCRTPPERGTVAGHFNVASTDDGYDDNGLGGIGAGIVPGAPIIDLSESEPP